MVSFRAQSRIVACTQAAPIPHPVIGSTRGYYKYIEALLTSCKGALTIGSIDLRKGFIFAIGSRGSF